MIKNIVFDWSGTLIDDVPPVLAGTNHVFEKIGKNIQYSREDFRREFCLPVMKFFDKVAPGQNPAQIKAWFLEAMAPLEHLVAPIDHAEDFLKFVREQKIQTFLFSSIQKPHYERLIAKNHFDTYFDHAFVEVWDKKSKILDLMKEFHLSPDETVFIGDMVHDMETAQHGKMHTCAVLTGYTLEADLQGCRPELILDNLLPLHKAIQKVGWDWTQICQALQSENRVWKE